MTVKIAGTVGDGSWSSTVVMNHAVYSTTNLATNFMGNYTMLIPGGDGVASPAGYGYGLVSVKTNGAITLSGALPDNSKLSQGVPISKDGHWPLYIPLYATKYVATNLTNNSLVYTNPTFKGSLMGWVFMTNNAPTGTLNWIKTGWTNFYPNGFTNQTDLIGSRYIIPADKKQVLSQTNGTITVSGGSLSSDLTKTVKLATKNMFVVSLPNTNQLKASITLATGTFQGSFLISNKAKVFIGAVLQEQNFAGGFFVETNGTGTVEFNAAP